MLSEPTGGSMKKSAAHGIRLERTIVISAFILLFPGFFFYNVLLGMGKIRAFLGGYFSPISLMFALPLVFMYVRQIKRDRTRLMPCEIYFGLFLAFFALVVAINAASGANMLIVESHAQGILFMANALIMFKLIDFSRPEFRIPAFLCLMGMTANILEFSIGGMFRMDELAMAKDPDSLATYQGLARSYLMTLLPFVTFTRRLPVRALLYAAGLAALFLNTARSEFVALLFAIPIIELYFARKKLLFILFIVVLGALIYANFSLILTYLPDNRILELLDLSHSNSAILRHHMLIHAMQTVSTHPFLGDYASYAHGHYAHNVLSAWVDLGIFGFVYLVALLILPAISMVTTGFFSNRFNGEFLLPFTLVCVTMLLLAKSHYFTDMLIGATLGAYSTYNYGRRAAKRGPPTPNFFNSAVSTPSFSGPVASMPPQP
jgi:hypothetical protein